MMKAKKWVGVDDYGDNHGGVDAIRGEIPYQARQVFRDILNDEFWTAAMAVNPNPPTAGNQSGVYIDYLYGLLELKSGLMETEFRDSVDEFLRAVLHYLGNAAGTGKKYEVYRLLYNESAHCVNQAQMQSYRDDGIDEFEDTAALDRNTCDTCAYYDGKHLIELRRGGLYFKQNFL